jgi:hypothetical protein
VELVKLKNQGSRFFAGHYMQIPSAEEGGIIKKGLFDIVEPSTLTREPINSPIHLIVHTQLKQKMILLQY